MKIRKLLAVVVAVVLAVSSLTACGSKKTDAKDGDTRTIRVAYMTAEADQYAGLIAEKNGYFKELGLNVEMTEYAVGINTIDAIANGTADVGLCADFAGVNRIGNTLEYNQLVFYAELSSGVAHVGGVYVAPEYADDIKKLENSPGMITTIGTVSEYYNWKAEVTLGLDPDKINVVATDGTLQTAVAAAMNGDASVVVSTGSNSVKYEEIGWVKVATAEEVDSKTGVYLVTSRSFVDEHADILADYLKALQKGIDYINENLDETAQYFSDLVGVEAENFKTDWVNRTLILGFTEAGAVNLENIQDWASTHGKYDTPYNVRDYIVTKAVEQAFPGRVTIK